MKRTQYSYVRELELIPTEYFVDKGCGESDITRHAGSFHLALQEAGIQNYNIMMYSSTLPAKCKESTKRPEMRFGSVMHTIMAKCEGVKGDSIAAGIVRGDLVKKTNGKLFGTLVCEIGEKLTTKKIETKLMQAVKALYKSGYSDEYELNNIRTEIQACKVKKKYGTVLVVLAFTEYESIQAPPKIEAANFLDIQRSYKNAEYVFQPVLYDGTATYKKGMAEGPLAILDASTHLERYDIETDFQIHREVDLYTAKPLELEDDPIEMIEVVQKSVTKILKDKKFPIILAGGHGVSIPIFYAIRDLKMNPTILQLDAHSDRRQSYDGTMFSEACVMSRGLECVDNIVQVGIRSISNIEIGVLDFDKLFLAADIMSGDDSWIDDVIEECTDDVYITFDVDVLDPSIVQTGTPEPGGLYYEDVLKLFKKLLKTRNVIGLDVNGLLPVPGMSGPEFTIAKLILQFISYREKFKK